MGRLKSELPKHLHYHSPAHTEYVLKLVKYIAEKEKIKSKKDLFLLKVAALYHDIGFINGPTDHEERSCKIATKELSKRNFSKEDISKICGMIMATKIPQQPKTNLEEILADADLEYLGTRHFIEVGDLLYKELLHYNENLTKDRWNEIQISFLKNHHYHTNYCRKYKEKYKQQHLNMLMQE